MRRSAHWSSASAYPHQSSPSTMTCLGWAAASYFMIWRFQQLCVRYLHILCAISHFVELWLSGNCLRFAPVREQYLSHDANTPAKPERMPGFFWAILAGTSARSDWNRDLWCSWGFWCPGLLTAWHWMVKEVKNAAMNSKTAWAPSPKSWP